MTRTAIAELLAPAGNWDCVRAAVANGADAVYFGLPRFNARTILLGPHRTAPADDHRPARHRSRG